MEIASAFNIWYYDLRAPLDAENVNMTEMNIPWSSIDVPIKEERNNQTYYVTIPLGLSLTEEYYRLAEKLPLLDIFINRRLRNFYAWPRIFQIPLS